MPARNVGAGRTSVMLGTKARDHIAAHVLIKRLQSFALIDPDNPKPNDIRMTRTQVHTALALLRKVLPDLAAVEVSGNPDKPLLVQLVRFSDGAVIDATPTQVLQDNSADLLDATDIPSENAIEPNSANDISDLVDAPSISRPSRDQDGA